VLLGLVACASPVADAPATDDGAPGTASAALTASLAGTYFFEIVSQRGEEVGNWSLHADGTLYSVSNGASTPAGTWSSDGTTVTIERALPYGSSCRYSAPITASGFATAAQPSTAAACTFVRLKPNPPKSWYALRIQ
jgi:hypothetical protein